MSKADKLFSKNQEIMEEFIEQASNSYHFKLNYKSSLKIFLDLYNGDKPKDITWEFKRSILTIRMKDVIDYQTFLNKSSKWSLVTKQTRFGHVRKFIRYILRNYPERFEPIPRLEFKADLDDKESYKWDRKGHKEPNTYYKRLTMTKDEALKILTYLYDNDYQKYLMFRVLTETGMRKGESLSIDIERNVEGRVITLEQDLKNRCLRVIGKMDKLKYFISEDLAKQLLEYLYTVRLTQQKDVNTKAFFISQKRNRFSHTALNIYLRGTKEKKGVLEKVGIKKHITPQTFRRTLNTFRYEMNCSVEDREVLLNHKSGKTNIDYYTVQRDDQLIELYDKWNPYKSLFNSLI